MSNAIDPPCRRDVLGLGIIAVAVFPVISGRAWASSATRLPALRAGFREFPFSSPLAAEARPGIYTCAGCGQPAFSSHAKYETGTGWPSFSAHLPGALRATGSALAATGACNVDCAGCGGRMGDLLPDGPAPRQQRFSINGAALVFRSVGKSGRASSS